MSFFSVAVKILYKNRTVFFFLLYFIFFLVFFFTNKMYRPVAFCTANFYLSRNIKYFQLHPITL
uniref:Uncharacterized protein n=1 Tax=Anguilla anguilla TaxID=7936 RepID=A0A0E9WDF1_ANGAN